MELPPKANCPFIQREMPDQCAVTLLRMTVEADMLHQEVPESFKQGGIPAVALQHRFEDTFQATILVAGDAGGLRMIVLGTGTGQVIASSLLYELPGLMVNWRKRQNPPHEFVMIERFARLCHPRPRRQIISRTLFCHETAQGRIVRIQGMGDPKILSKLDREIVVSPGYRRYAGAVEAGPVKITYGVYDRAVVFRYGEYGNCVVQVKAFPMTLRVQVIKSDGVSISFLH